MNALKYARLFLFCHGIQKSFPASLLLSHTLTCIHPDLWSASPGILNIGKVTPTLAGVRCLARAGFFSFNWSISRWFSTPPSTLCGTGFTSTGLHRVNPLGVRHAQWPCCTLWNKGFLLTKSISGTRWLSARSLKCMCARRGPERPCACMMSSDFQKLG